MNDDELRAFLESATVGGPDPEDGRAAESEAPTATSDEALPEASQPPAAPARPAAPQPPAVPLPPVRSTYQQPQQPSFDELLGLRRDQEPNPIPLVLPEPTKKSRPAPDLEPVFVPNPPQPAAPRPAVQAPDPHAAQPASDALPPTQPLSVQDIVPPAAPAPVPAAGVQPPAQPASPPFVPPAPIAAAASAQPLFPNASAPASPSAAQPTAPVSATASAAAVTPDPLDSIFARSAQPEAADQGDEYEKISVTGGDPRSRRFLPWVIVGGGAVIALIASIFIINAVRGGTEPGPTAAPPATTTQTQTTEPTTTSPEPTETNEPTTPTADQPPRVEVGSTMTLDIPWWGVTADLSTKFGQTSYAIDANGRLVLTSSLIDSLPAACRAGGQEWGITKIDDASFEVLRPAERCADAPELYDELWGLTAAMVDSIRPQ